ncbi:beta-hexosaminidase [mine drainage metagenome]|uniref:beta-N-acetylhexosaminidase n=1 Tax=mine drainage metagenome TaxID=410659 RepID=A0A1J5SW77_9ZZZZ
MLRLITFLTTVLFSFSISAQQNILIIPQPVSLIAHYGTFVIDTKTDIQFQKDNKELKEASKFLIFSINEISGISLVENRHAKKSINLIIRRIKEIGQEGYLLNVTTSSIQIIANNKVGIVYAIQTLLQTLPGIRTNAALNIPCMEVKDYPRFEWRGMHLDVSRHFFSEELVKEYIDLMAKYKMNTFHWHLVDDQGWRIEIKKYPELTRTGAWRVNQLDKIWGSRPQAKEGEVADYGGYYTQKQIKEIVAYAAQRNITIIPEIEMPGHVASAIASYPQLSCSKKPQLPLTGGNYTNISSNYCAGNDSVFIFLQNVLTEVMQLFPSKYIHVGGDEVDKTAWKNCVRCQKRIKDEGLKNEDELQSYFMKRIEKFIVSKKRKMIGWDEILEGGLAPEATVMSWRGETGGIAAAKMNHDVVMTPGSPCYFNHYQAGPEGEPIAIGGMNTLKTVYDYNPIPKELNEKQAKYILGTQANLWTEFITTNEQVQYMILPRMLALAEVSWSQKGARNWNSFNQRLKKSFEYFDEKGYHYCKGNFKVDIHPFSQNGKLKVSLSSEIIDGSIYYTIDGSEPDVTSKKYTSSFTIDSSLTVKAVIAVNGMIMGSKPAMQKFVMHKAVGRDVLYTNPVSKYYMADGINSLTDGVRGTLAANKYWHGFNGKDLIATIDLGELKSVQSISLGCLQRYSDWIFLPQSVKFETSIDGINFIEAGKINNDISVNEKSPLIKDFKILMMKQNIRYVRVTAKILNACPKGHSGEGQPAWLFADEIIVE